MQTVLYYIFIVPILYTVSVLPFPLLYILSDVFYFFTYYAIRYRKKVVFTNLRKSFPEKSETEINAIAKKFYASFCDVFLETIKILTISEKELLKRCSFSDEGKAVFNAYYEKKQNVIGVMGHCGNWEWACLSFKLSFKQQLSGLYHPLANKNIDGLMLKIRSRFGSHIIAMKNLPRELPKIKNMNTVIGLIADQTPPAETAYWTTFLNQDTPVFFGTEKLAKKLNYPAVFVSVKRTKRGYYNLSAETITDLPNSLPEGEISELHTKILEKNIREQPESWLWSHRRWKHFRAKR
jgi:KDO2-lipid IV(A) lauroyltransferase